MIKTASELLQAPRAAFLSDAPESILRFAVDGIEKGVGVALATLVDVRGGSARAIGSHMAIHQDGTYCGVVSGGCTETAIAAEAVLAISAGNDQFMMLGDGSPFFDIALPCGGGITVSIHVLRHGDCLRHVIRELSARRRTGLVYDPARQSLRKASPDRLTGWVDGCFQTSYRPKTRVCLFGRSIELETTHQVAAAAGYEVCRATADDMLAAGSIDEDSAVAMLFHDLDKELAILEGALTARPFYIGALGSARTHQRRTSALLDRGFAQSDVARIKAPIGLFPKARTAPALALSILADIAAADTSRH